MKKIKNFEFWILLAGIVLMMAFPANAADFYVDQKTKQVFTEPGPNRKKMNDEEIQKKSEPENNNTKKWYDKFLIRGYTQLRFNHLFDEPNGPAKLRSVHDASVGDDNGFLLRRVRVILMGEINDYVSLYLQPDFAATVRNQSGSESRLNFAQLRDAYVDIFFNKGHEYRLRIGQSKVPFGWENLQSSQKRLTLDRADALNSAVPGERDLGVFAYWSPKHVQNIWKRLDQVEAKTSGDYGVIGVGVYNGQGINFNEKNNNLYVSAHTTYPLALDFLGKAFKDQVFEFGVDAIRGKFIPEIGAFATADGVSSFTPAASANILEQRVGVHAILFPQPFGLQAEWNWGEGPELDLPTQTIQGKKLNGGYVQAMYRVHSKVGYLTPYAKHQHYRGGWKGNANSPRLETDEFEAGVEWEPIKPIELTLAYSHMNRTNMNNSSYGKVTGNLVRAQLQWNF